ncbi:hypothetical protein SAMN06264364_13256 [Quadrisphaera granulorum]|uniref:Uncharacterized protein n=2 Tax=Quadrisphaera granulorum TaxID=317664 RepID=A0A315ZRL0_9ACTN|nr:hypothetical protein BXY45_13256 [Quadrisphaera granulorum]SZE98545.1 hypothetical protein SAMN06264364_13256 [Quadrisphaera granulorum]
MPAPQVLDFPVAVPAHLTLDELVVVGKGWGGDDARDTSCRWENVEVAGVTSDYREPMWRLETRPRRGIRPAAPSGAGLLLDPDVATLAADAVHLMLSSRIPTGIGGEETQRRMQACWERSQALREVFSPLPSATSPWQRRELDVDGQRYAWWVHEDELGWAGAADLGPVFVETRGRGAAPSSSWSLRLLPPPEAAQLLVRA